jgi:hypothetical protein
MIPLGSRLTDSHTVDSHTVAATVSCSHKTFVKSFVDPLLIVFAVAKSGSNVTTCAAEPRVSPAVLFNSLCGVLHVQIYTQWLLTRVLSVVTVTFCFFFALETSKPFPFQPIAFCFSYSS